MTPTLNKTLVAAAGLASATAVGATYSFVDTERQAARDLEIDRLALQGPTVNPMGRGAGTKQGGYAVKARLNGANKRARAARKASRRTRNGQHL